MALVHMSLHWFNESHGLFLVIQYQTVICIGQLLATYNEYLNGVSVLQYHNVSISGKFMLVISIRWSKALRISRTYYILTAFTGLKVLSVHVSY